MAIGFQITDSSGLTQVDENNRCLHLIDIVDLSYIGTMPSGLGTMDHAWAYYGTKQYTKYARAVLKTSHDTTEAYWMDFMGGGLYRWGFPTPPTGTKFTVLAQTESATSSGRWVRAYIYDVPSFPVTGSGLVIFDPSGNQVFHSQYPVLNVLTWATNLIDLDPLDPLRFIPTIHDYTVPSTANVGVALTQDCYGGDYWDDSDHIQRIWWRRQSSTVMRAFNRHTYSLNSGIGITPHRRYSGLLVKLPPS